MLAFSVVLGVGWGLFRGIRRRRHSDDAAPVVGSSGARGYAPGPFRERWR